MVRCSSEVTAPVLHGSNLHLHVLNQTVALAPPLRAALFFSPGVSPSGPHGGEAAAAGGSVDPLHAAKGTRFASVAPPLCPAKNGGGGVDPMTGIQPHVWGLSVFFLAPRRVCNCLAESSTWNALRLKCGCGTIWG